MSKKTPVKCYLPQEQIEILDRIRKLTGEDRSGMLRTALMHYAIGIGAVNERLLKSIAE